MCIVGMRDISILVFIVYACDCASRITTKGAESVQWKMDQYDLRFSPYDGVVPSGIVPSGDVPPG